jgi:hypothetical protein
LLGFEPKTIERQRKKEDMTQYPPLVYFLAFIIARNSFVFDFLGQNISQILCKIAHGVTLLLEQCPLYDI